MKLRAGCYFSVNQCSKQGDNFGKAQKTYFIRSAWADGINLSAFLKVYFTWRESAGKPIEVVVRSPMIDRKRIPMAKVRLRFENGTRMTIIDWEIVHGLTLLLLGLFIRATTCERLGLRIFSAPPGYLPPKNQIWPKLCGGKTVDFLGSPKSMGGGGEGGGPLFWTKS